MEDCSRWGPAGIDITVHIAYKRRRSGDRGPDGKAISQAMFAGPCRRVIGATPSAGKLRMLGVTSVDARGRAARRPDHGGSRLSRLQLMTFWTGVVAPAGTPAAVIARLNGVINDAPARPTR